MNDKCLCQDLQGLYICVISIRLKATCIVWLSYRTYEMYTFKAWEMNFEKLALGPGSNL